MTKSRGVLELPGPACKNRRQAQNRFADSRAALEFLVSRIVAEARPENVPLSDVQRDMLYCSETAWTLPRGIRRKDRTADSASARHARSENQPEFDGWSDTFRVLSEEDRYLLVIAGESRRSLLWPPGGFAGGRSRVGSSVLTSKSVYSHRATTRSPLWFGHYSTPAFALLLVRVLISDK